MRVSEDWLRMLDLARGEESRGGFEKRLVEGAHGGVVAEDAPASARAVPAARVTLAEEFTETDRRRVAAGLPPLSRPSSPSLRRFAPDGRA